jgi:hypothetical protein
MESKMTPLMRNIITKEDIIQAGARYKFRYENSGLEPGRMVAFGDTSAADLSDFCYWLNDKGIRYYFEDRTGKNQKITLKIPRLSRFDLALDWSWLYSWWKIKEMLWGWEIEALTGRSDGMTKDITSWTQSSFFILCSFSEYGGFEHGAINGIITLMEPGVCKTLSIIRQPRVFKNGAEDINVNLTPSIRTTIEKQCQEWRGQGRELVPLFDENGRIMIPTFISQDSADTKPPGVA